ncbi:MAG: pantothenate synthase [Thelocarpon superellum]|nr:MAG: pantothenate synthase [Thelocarpon superellum]
MATPVSTSTAKMAPPTIRIFRDIPPLRDFRRALLRTGQTVGLVPTMGALHAGHLSLMRKAAKENDHVIVSVYVNPTQFGANEDLDSYPRTWDADLQALQDLDGELERVQRGGNILSYHGGGRIAAIFAPTTETMYPTLPPSSDPNAQGSFVTITPLGSVLEGASRPTFFRGVATVCMKLFNIVTPDRVYFGQKDIQQTVIIKRMVKDFGMSIDVRVSPTEREPEGLAMSSRNVYLGERRRAVAVTLSSALKHAETQYRKGYRQRSDILAPSLDLIQINIQDQLERLPSQRARLELDYLSLADMETLEELEEVDGSRGAILSGAVKMLPIEEAQLGEDCGLTGGGSPVRLIDNIILEAEAPQESCPPKRPAEVG